MTLKVRRSKYPWALWTNGEQHTIYRHLDYTISTMNMQISLHGRARVQGLKVTSRSFVKREWDDVGQAHDVEGLMFQFLKDSQ